MRVSPDRGQDPRIAVKIFDLRKKLVHFRGRGGACQGSEVVLINAVLCVECVRIQPAVPSASGELAAGPCEIVREEGRYTQTGTLYRHAIRDT